MSSKRWISKPNSKRIYFSVSTTFFFIYSYSLEPKIWILIGIFWPSKIYIAEKVLWRGDQKLLIFRKTFGWFILIYKPKTWIPWRYPSDLGQDSPLLKNKSEQLRLTQRLLILANSTILQLWRWVLPLDTRFLFPVRYWVLGVEMAMEYVVRGWSFQWASADRRRIFSDNFT